MFIFVGHLRRQDYQSSDRIIWTIILATLPVVGLLLYLLLSRQPLQRDAESSAEARARKDAEAELRIKAKFNNQG